MADTTWAARVEWDADVDPDDSYVDAFMDGLSAHSVALGIDGRRVSAQISVTASTVRQAVAAALAAAENAGRAAGRRVAPIGVEVLDEPTFERRMAEPTIPELVGHAEIAAMAGVSRQRAAQLAGRDDFPPAVVVTAAGPLRVRAQVEAWLGSWERRPGRPAKEA